MKILVAYATAHGSTAEVANVIGQALQEREFDVTVANVIHVDNIDAYDVFVLGSAVHGGMWLTDMSQFLEHFATVLMARPVFFFLTCIRVLEEGGYDHAVSHYVHPEVVEKFGMRELTAFAGKLDLSQVDWDERWTLAARYDGASAPGSYNRDYRDWDAIRTWASRVADKLLTSTH